MDEALRADWDSLADALAHLLLDILRDKPVTTTEQRWRDPRVIGIMLSARSLSNFRGVFVLLDAGLIVEARTLVRSLFEDAFWLAALLAEGVKFVSELLDDDARSSKLRAEIILRASAGSRESDMRIREQLRSITARYPKAALLRPKEVAETGPLKDFYVVYAQLSADSAHPTLTALSRYLARASLDSDCDVNVEPEVRRAELVNTLDWACNAMLNVTAALNEILEASKGDDISVLASKYAALAAEGRKAFAGKWAPPPLA